MDWLFCSCNHFIMVKCCFSSTTITWLFPYHVSLFKYKIWKQNKTWTMFFNNVKKLKVLIESFHLSGLSFSFRQLRIWRFTWFNQIPMTEKVLNIYYRLYTGKEVSPFHGTSMEYYTFLYLVFFVKTSLTYILLSPCIVKIVFAIWLNK